MHREQIDNQKITSITSLHYWLTALQWHPSVAVAAAAAAFADAVYRSVSPRLHVRLGRT